MSVRHLFVVVVWGGVRGKFFTTGAPEDISSPLHMFLFLPLLRFIYLRSFSFPSFCNKTLFFFLLSLSSPLHTLISLSLFLFSYLSFLLLTNLSIFSSFMFFFLCYNYILFLGSFFSPLFIFSFLLFRLFPLTEGGREEEE